MAQYDVHRLVDGTGLVLDCQSDLFDRYGARVCVPLLPPALAPIIVPRLNPLFTIDSEKLVFVPHFITALPLAALGPAIVNLAAEHFAITDALDMLFNGF